MNTLLTYITWDVDPRIFPGFDMLRWYGLLWALGLGLGYQVMTLIYKKEGRTIAQLDRLAVYVIIGAIVGARLGHVLFYDFEYYSQHPIEVLPIKLEPHFQFTGLTGLASHGGVFGVLLALYFYTRKHKEDYVWLLDRLMISGAVLGGCIRLGNLMNSEIIGIETTVPWAFIFTSVDNVPRHPAQLYEAIFYFMIFFVLYTIWRSMGKNLSQGYILAWGLILVFGQRILVEFLKENQVAFEDGLILNMGQILSIPLVLLGIVMLIYTKKMQTNKPVVES